MNWEIVMGLEVHLQLATQSKIFSGSATQFGAEPNCQADPVDLGMPGMLPVLNEEAVRHAVKFGLGIGAKIGERSVFDRKNYFYPDLPKGYQVSQFFAPIVCEGVFEVPMADGSLLPIRITRAHLEEDAGKSVHDIFPRETGIDLNRAGTPLLEIVTEPDFRTAEQAVAYLKALHSLVTYLGISDGNMAEGSMRCDINISLRKQGTDALGTRTEIKNANSFSGNCYEGNVYQTSTPPLLEQLHNCSSLENDSFFSRFPLQGDVSGLMMLAGFFADAQNEELDKNRYKEYPWPKEQQSMNFKNGGWDTPNPAINLFYLPNLDDMELPYDLMDEEFTNLFEAKKEIIMSGVPISSPSIWQLLFQLYGYLMPFVLYAAWTALALYDLNTNNQVAGGKRYLWLAIVFLVPFFGVLAYHLIGPSSISKTMKYAAIGGGLISYLIILVLTAVVSGLV